MKPACWGSAASWVEWQKFNEQAGSAPGKALDHYCVDCTPEYQAKMVAQQRCAYPDATFISIVERRRDPETGKPVAVSTGLVRGKRSPEDEAAWQRRFEIRKEEKDGQD